MKYLIITISIFFPYCNQCDIRVLSDSEKITRIENKQFYDWKVIPIYDTAGTHVAPYEISSWSNKEFIFDEYVDCNNKIVKLQIRRIRSSDLTQRMKIDSIMSNNLDIKIAHLKFIEKDTIKLKDAIELATFLAPFEYLNINCKDVCSVLNAVLESDQTNRTSGRMSRQIDRDNIIKIESIIHHCGWTAIENCGEAGINAAFYTIQHAQPAYRSKHLDKFIELSQSGLIRKSTLALMIDRTRRDTGLKQLYGTQFMEERTSGKRILYELEDPIHVDSLRREMDLEPLEYYLKNHKIERSN